MSDNSFKVKNGLTLNPIDLTSNPPLNPQAGDVICDSSDNNKIKRYDANASAWVEVGSGGIGGVDIFFVQDFESASLNSFTQTGLTLTQTDPLKGKVSALLTHQAAINQSFKQILPVDRKFRGIPMVLRLDSKSSASQGNVTINIYDETNSANIVASEQLQISNDTAGKKTSVSFTIPATCASISYTITALPEAGSPTTRIDDIICEIAETALLETAVEVPNMTAWQGYTPTFQGFGTPTNVEFEWRQVGENVEIRGKFVSGVPTIIEARIGLPNGLTSAGTSLIPSIQIVGKGNRSISTTTYFSGLTLLIEPSVTYLTLGGESSTTAGIVKQNASVIVANGDMVSFFASVPCSGLSAKSTKTIPLTQSGLIQEADSSIRVDTANGLGSSSTKIRRFLNTIEVTGSDVVYSDSATNGASFTIQSDGIYSISYVDAVTNSSGIMVLKNPTYPVTSTYTNILSSFKDNVLSNTYASSTSITDHVTSWTGKLNAGDIIVPYTEGAAPGVNNRTRFTITKQGNLKQVNINPESKITIPTSELRFEGASARGTGTETAIVQFTSVAKIRGDAFSFDNSNGTAITMLKSGKLSVSTTLSNSTTSSTFQITKNQSTRTALSVISEEILGTQVCSAAGHVTTCSVDVFVNVGDVIRVAHNQTPTANVNHSLNLSFQEQDISVSITNTLPQFSDSDSCVQLSGAGASPFGSTATTTRRFASVVQNIGSDIEYIDSPTLGGQFIAKSAGIYHVSYTENTTASTTGAAAFINVNNVVVAQQRDLINTAAASAKILNAAWSGYLNIGDVVSGSVISASDNNGNAVFFTISKVGKPNVTGVDVTPFVNVPQPTSQSSYLEQTTSFAIATITGALTSSIGNDIYTYNSNTGIYTMLKKANVNISATFKNAAAATTLPTIVVSGVDKALDQSPAIIDYRTSCSYTGILQVGETFLIANKSSGTTNQQFISVSATALSDQILTQPETFSTDTAALKYANASEYTLSTLQNAPVGTYITFTYAANTNTRTQTTLTNRPSQTDTDMNANGIQIFARAYNAPSTAGNPAAIAIQIGKGMKGRTIDFYKTVGKTIPGSIDVDNTGNSSEQLYGIQFKDYDETTGILYIDAGYTTITTTTSHTFRFTDLATQANGYLVINASKNPALTGIGLNRIALRATSTAGGAIGTTATLQTFAEETFDTNGAWNGTTYTVPETGYYQINSGISTAIVTLPTGGGFAMWIYKNGVAETFQRVIGNGAGNLYGCAVNDILYLKKDDTIQIYASASVATTQNTTAGYNFISISKVSV